MALTNATWQPLRSQTLWYYKTVPLLCFHPPLPITLLLSLTCVALLLITLTFPFLYFLLSMLSTSGGIHSCTLCTLPTQHPSCVPHLTAARLPLGGFEVIPSCSGTARWCCWSAAPWHGGWHPARAPRTRSPAGLTAAGEGCGPSGWWVWPRRPGWEFPQSEGAEGSPVKTTHITAPLAGRKHAVFVMLSMRQCLKITHAQYISSIFIIYLLHVGIYL